MARVDNGPTLVNDNNDNKYSKSWITNAGTDSENEVIFFLLLYKWSIVLPPESTTA